MLYSTLFLALVSASLTEAVPPAQSVKRDASQHSLMLQVKTQDDMKSCDDLSVAATIVNTGSKAVKILNDPNSALSTWKTHTFNFVPVPVAGPDGVKSKAAGALADVDAIRVKYNPRVAAALDDASAYTVLQPGENKTVVHDLSGMYNFHSAGSYAVKLTSVAEYFNVVEEDGSITSVPATLTTGEEADKLAALNVLSTAVLASKKGLSNTGVASIDAIASSLTASLPLNRMVKRQGDARFRNCTSEQQAGLTAAAQEANEYIANANEYFNGALGDRYTTWFGDLSDNRTEIVKGHFVNITGKPDQFQFDCSCTKPDTFAYVYPNKFPTVYLCGAFWKAPVKGTDSKAGTIVHEGTHFVNIGGTDDYAYGQSGAKELAKNDPDRAIMNADSHEYFVENTPQLN